MDKYLYEKYSLFGTKPKEQHLHADRNKGSKTQGTYADKGIDPR